MKVIDSNINFNEGFTLLIDKKLDWTSFDVVRKIRNITKSKKVGHAGTLDPLASGLLIICTGKHTKKINEFLNLDKTYTGKFVIGSTTPSHDLETEIENTKSISGINKNEVDKIVNSFLGIQLQRPPKYSAVKIDGKRAYELARKEQDFKIKEKEIKINEFKILNFSSPVIEFYISCSKGTYIRSLARDIGLRLGCGAYLSELRRTKIGNFDVDDASTIEEFEFNLKGKY
tara:strand:- start:212 stop:901 length:690 start_codon:yes stop_codon:yes gene_type:complete